MRTGPHTDRYASPSGPSPTFTSGCPWHVQASPITVESDVEPNGPTLPPPSPADAFVAAGVAECVDGVTTVSWTVTNNTAEVLTLFESAPAVLGVSTVAATSSVSADEVFEGPAHDGVVSHEFWGASGDDQRWYYAKPQVDVVACVASGTPPSSTELPPETTLPTPPPPGVLAVSGVAVCVAGSDQVTVTWTVTNNTVESLTMSEFAPAVFDPPPVMAPGAAVSADEVVDVPASGVVSRHFWGTSADEQNWYMGSADVVVNCPVIEPPATTEVPATTEAPASTLPPPSPADAFVAEGAAQCVDGVTTVSWTVTNNTAEVLTLFESAPAVLGVSSVAATSSVSADEVFDGPAQDGVVSHEFWGASGDEQRWYYAKPQVEVAACVPSGTPPSSTELPPETTLPPPLPVGVLAASGVAVCVAGSDQATVTWTVTNNTSESLTMSEFAPVVFDPPPVMAPGDSVSADEVVDVPATGVVSRHFWGMSADEQNWYMATADVVVTCPVIAPPASTEAPADDGGAGRRRCRRRRRRMRLLRLVWRSVWTV